jgi:hypothetical protein
MIHRNISIKELESAVADMPYALVRQSKHNKERINVFVKIDKWR